MQAIRLFWGEPLGFAIGFQPVVPADSGVDVDEAVPLLADDGTPSAEAGVFFSGDDLIVRAVTEPPTPVEHPRYGELWQGTDDLLFRSQAELDAWLASMAEPG